ncbi:MAG: SGNH/GDSL hydrolase family protein [Akkermansiaceae bacterium]|jgi:lysophospholipase L1-like esterase|tara:strand:- start:4725 stop:5618 length:894 start_codon:yes stop_codon:yes gene_type:complete
MKPWLLFLLLTIIPVTAVTFEDDDMVAFLGNTVIERAQKYGHFETTLTLASEKKNLKFRNFGWSGDTVFGHARSYFGPPKEGFDRLKADLGELKPNVIIICYGAGAAFEGEKGLTEFITGYERLLDMVKASAKPREIVIVSPPPAESLGSPMPDMTEHNQRLARYSKALFEMAKEHDLHFADFFATVGDSTGLTDNGLHFTENGYQTVAPKFVQALGLTLPTGNQLQSEPARKLRATIIAKNKFFFFRWRPANETYLRLFRKHEQGNNVKELPMFDPIIADREKEIETLKKTTLAVK